MKSSLEFSEVYKLLNAIKEGDASKKEKLNAILSDYKEGVNAESFLHELGQKFLSIGIEELFSYTNSVDLQYIGHLTSEEWDALADKNNGEFPIHIANKMINSFKDNQFWTKLSSKWSTSRGEIEKHVRPMSRYITEGIIDVLE